MFGSSSRYRMIEGVLIDMNELKKKSREQEIKLLSTQASQDPISDEDSNKEKPKNNYRLNKSNVKKKCTAFSRLEKSKAFLAFYSISFPQGLPDENAYRIFNSWLTRCRKNCSLKSYLWIAERQKNGTIHFHLLTNDFMAIKQVNEYMAKCMYTEKKKGLELLKEINTEKYNGVDVKKVEKKKDVLINYLAKYVTKNEIELTHLPWHCSRDVSRLCTSINYDNEDEDEDFYYDKLPYEAEHYQIKVEEYFSTAAFKFRPKDEIFSDLDFVNEMIYNSTL